MCDLLGDTYMSKGNVHGALRSFEQAVQLHQQAMHHVTPVPQVISLVCFSMQAVVYVDSQKDLWLAV